MFDPLIFLPDLPSTIESIVDPLPPSLFIFLFLFFFFFLSLSPAFFLKNIYIYICMMCYSYHYKKIYIYIRLCPLSLGRCFTELVSGKYVIQNIRKKIKHQSIISLYEPLKKVSSLILVISYSINCKRKI